MIELYSTGCVPVVSSTAGSACQPGFLHDNVTLDQHLPEVKQSKLLVR